jgi:hypothetical protein
MTETKNKKSGNGIGIGAALESHSELLIAILLEILL